MFLIIGLASCLPACGNASLDTKNLFDEYHDDSKHVNHMSKAMEEGNSTFNYS